MTYRSSFSQHDVFEKCPRWWYFLKVKEVPVISDFCYANAGSCLHKTLEKYYNKELTDMEQLKEFFNSQWSKYKLEQSKIAEKKDEYWVMVLNGINLDEKFTSTELKIYYPDGLAYIDVVNSEEDKIGDWKSSTRREDNEESYKKQIQMYSWFYKRKFNRIPTESTVFYLKYNGSKGKMSFNFTEEDIKEIETWYNNILGEMNNIIETKKVPPKCESCHIFCPYEEICQKEEEFIKFDIHIFGNNLQLFSPINSLIHKALMKKFSYELKNAYFMKKNNPYARTTIEFWKPKKQLLPYGFLYGMKKTLQDYIDYKGIKGEINIIDHREFNQDIIDMPNEFKNGIKLRDYQIEAADKFLENKIGMLELGTGAGKTIIISEIVRRLGRKTLILVNRVDLLRQIKKVLEDTLGVEVGTISQGQSDIKTITIATIQTIYKNINIYSDYLKTVRVSIMDEAHNVNHLSYWRVSQHLTNTEYRLGTTGTPRRTDGNDMYLNAVNGYVVFKMNSEKLIEDGWLMKPKIIFIKDYMNKDIIKQMEEESKVGLINETDNYSSFYNKFIVENQERNNIVQKLINKHKGEKTLILVKLVKHGEYLSKMLGVFYLKGSTKKEIRKQTLDDFKNGKLNILIGTISIFAEGLDIPSLKYLINAAGQVSDIKTIQTLGRLLRKHEGKESCTYYDFIDESRFMRKASNSRQKAFKDENHNINYVKYNDFFLEANSQSLYNG